jgi:hypothetical protein
MDIDKIDLEIAYENFNPLHGCYIPALDEIINTNDCYYKDDEGNLVPAIPRNVYNFGVETIKASTISEDTFEEDMTRIIGNGIDNQFDIPVIAGYYKVKCNGCGKDNEYSREVFLACDILEEVKLYDRNGHYNTILDVQQHVPIICNFCDYICVYVDTCIVHGCDWKYFRINNGKDGNNCCVQHKEEFGGLCPIGRCRKWQCIHS